ncbi:hypothetical protein [Bosea sp. TND4EK4]|uniref:hypothetical protein n=1 Tax=Bosea sp. TND4EK4 TaxID=1907408 RepID=UPI000953A878|nr:hypothetical protein [Bosea sp. TND4EK4]SIQ25403.1 hypothetical protein SAMN05880592_102167 [Bosea sp. TND4EK4]
MPIETEERAKEQASMREGESFQPLRAEAHTTLDPARETPVEARQGFLGRPVLMVLVAGLVLAMIAWFVVDISV